MKPKYLELDNLERWRELLDLSASELTTGIEAKYWYFYALFKLDEFDKAISFLSENEEEINAHPKWAFRWVASEPTTEVAHIYNVPTTGAFRRERDHVGSF